MINWKGGSGKEPAVTHLRYAAIIQESDTELEQVERSQRDRRLGQHVRMLRLLKSGQATTMSEVAQLVGYSVPQVNRWWARYRTGGLTALLQPAVHPGRPSRMTVEALTRVQAAMEQGEIATLEETRQFVATQDQIVYRSFQGIAKVLAKYHIKKKTGRRRHRKTSAEVQQAFKKTSPP
jgi:transposase